MRKVVAGLFISLDGVTQDPQNWQMGLMDEEAGSDVSQAMEEADTILLGRDTYEEFAAYRPNAAPDDPFAARLAALPARGMTGRARRGAARPHRFPSILLVQHGCTVAQAIVTAGGRVAIGLR